MKKALFTIIVGISLFLCAIIMPFLVIMPLISEKQDDQFLIPGSKEITIGEDGKYYLWNNYRTIYQNKSYADSAELPEGLTFSLKDLASGQTFAIIPDKSMSSSGRECHKKSIGYYELKKGKYLLEVNGEVSPRVLSFSPGILGSILLIVFSIFGAIFLAFLSLFIVIIGMVFWLQFLADKPKDAAPAG